jgi:hypothetical protein
MFGMTGQRKVSAERILGKECCGFRDLASPNGARGRFLSVGSWFQRCNAIGSDKLAGVSARRR